MRQVQYVGRRCHWLRGLAGLLGVRAALIAAAAGLARACVLRISARVCFAAAVCFAATVCARGAATTRHAVRRAGTWPRCLHRGTRRTPRPNATAMAERRHTRRGDGG